MNDYAIVVLSGYADIFEKYMESAAKFERDTATCAVTSGLLSKVEAVELGDSWIAGPEPFSFPRNANIGIRAAGRADVFLVNDDVQFLKPNSVATLARIAHEHPEVGVLSPVFEGRVGNSLQESGAWTTKRPGALRYSTQRLCFTGVYIRRAVINHLGLLDERFDGYGRDDDDYCKRVQDAGFKLAVTPEVVMRHGFGADQHSASFKRAGRYPPSGMDGRMNMKWRDKWGLK